MSTLKEQYETIVKGLQEKSLNDEKEYAKALEMLRAQLRQKNDEISTTKRIVWALETFAGITLDRVNITPNDENLNLAIAAGAVINSLLELRGYLNEYGMRLLFTGMEIEDALKDYDLDGNEVTK